MTREEDPSNKEAAPPKTTRAKRKLAAADDGGSQPQEATTVKRPRARPTNKDPSPPTSRSRSLEPATPKAIGTTASAKARKASDEPAPDAYVYVPSTSKGLSQKAQKVTRKTPSRSSSPSDATSATMTHEEPAKKEAALPNMTRAKRKLAAADDSGSQPQEATTIKLPRARPTNKDPSPPTTRSRSLKPATPKAIGTTASAKARKASDEPAPDAYVYVPSTSKGLSQKAQKVTRKTPSRSSSPSDATSATMTHEEPAKKEAALPNMTRAKRKLAAADDSGSQPQEATTIKLPRARPTNKDPSPPTTRSRSLKPATPKAIGTTASAKARKASDEPAPDAYVYVPSTSKGLSQKAQKVTRKTPSRSSSPSDATSATMTHEEPAKKEAALPNMTRAKRKLAAADDGGSQPQEATTVKRPRARPTNKDPSPPTSRFRSLEPATPKAIATMASVKARKASDEPAPDADASVPSTSEELSRKPQRVSRKTQSRSSSPSDAISAAAKTTMRGQRSRGHSNGSSSHQAKRGRNRGRI
nr:proteoglycan 4-like [Dermacentor andersoni]